MDSPGRQRLLFCFLSTAFVWLFLGESPRPPTLTSESSVVVFGNSSFFFSEVVQSLWLSLLFPWFHSVVPYDQRPWKAGKVFVGKLELPLLGAFVSYVKLRKIQSSLLVFESDLFFKPVFAVKIDEVRNRTDRTRLEVELISECRSPLFNIVIKPILRFVLYHQMKIRLFTIQHNVKKRFNEVAMLSEEDKKT